jgi:hypothetical protein
MATAPVAGSSARIASAKPAMISSASRLIATQSSLVTCLHLVLDRGQQRADARLPLPQQPVLAPQVVVYVCLGVGEHRGDVREREAELPVEEDLAQSAQVVLGVQAVARLAAPARRQQPDGVAVVQGAHRHVRQARELTNRVLGHGSDCRPSRSVRVKR